jgi:histidine ammonia-lyase
MQEDHVSMGWHAARKLRTALDAFRDVVAIELLAAARALALRAPLEPSVVTGAIADRVNALSGGPGPDRWLSPEIAAISDLVANRELLDIASRYVTLQ